MDCIKHLLIEKNFVVYSTPLSIPLVYTAVFKQEICETNFTTSRISALNYCLCTRMAHAAWVNYL